MSANLGLTCPYYSFLSVSLDAFTESNWVSHFLGTRKCPLCVHILASPERLHAPKLPGVDPRSKVVIPRQFKRKKAAGYLRWACRVSVILKSL